MSKKMYVTTLDHREDGSAVLTFPPDLIKDLKWQEGDVIDISVNEETNEIYFVKSKGNDVE